MTDTITLTRSEYDNIMRTLGRADAAVSYLMSSRSSPWSCNIDACLALLGVNVAPLQAHKDTEKDTTVTECET